MDKPLGSYIHGAYTETNQRETFRSYNPANGQCLAKIANANIKDIHSAIDSAKQGMQTWQAMSGSDRAEILYRAAQLLRARNQELALLEMCDTGKPIQETETVDIYSGADCLAFFAGLADKLYGKSHDLGDAFFYTRQEPLGVCASIGAWNYPLQIACWKSAPALACGNSVIFKPAELTPLSALKLAEIFTEAGLPNGVFNVLQGDAQVGKILTEHPGIAKVSLTGEIGTGKKVMAQAASQLTPVSMELGGKSPILIFPDANLDKAAKTTVLANFYTQGEVCSNATRVFVHADIYDQFLEKLIKLTKQIKVGDPSLADTQMGALISAEHLDKVLSYVASGIAQGAHLVLGGERINVRHCEEGHFMAPTIFANCEDHMDIVQQEIFGPVMSVLKFEDEQEVLSRANNTYYGLAAGIFTDNLSRAHRLAKQLQAGVIWVNNYNLTPIAMPFGGQKQSGIGVENGLEVMSHYVQNKSVYVDLG